MSDTSTDSQAGSPPEEDTPLHPGSFVSLEAVLAGVDELSEAASEVERLLRAAVTPMPPTDIRAEALEACQRVRKALEGVR